MFEKKLRQKIFDAYNNQNKRCYCKTNNRYSTYGAKGIEVDYSLAEFCNWFKKNLPNKDLKKWSVGRIDHNKNYSLDNIEFQTKSENSKERLRRKGMPTRSQYVAVLCRDADTNEPLIWAESQYNMAELVNLAPNTISSHCNGHYEKTKCGLKFEYYKGAS